jgi:hypothetical protein
MRKNEPLAANRHVGPIPFFDNAGQLLPDQTFLTASGEVFVSKDGAAWVAAAADATAIGGGFYDVLASQAETNVDTYFSIRLVKATYADVAFRQDVTNNVYAADAILDALLQDHSIVGSVADGIAIAAGLLQGNFFIDNTVNTDPNGQTAARMRVFRNSVDAAAASPGGSGEGEFALFSVTTTYVGVNKIATHRVVRV